MQATSTHPSPYPRPQLERTQWQSLDGTWEFSFDPRGEFHKADRVHWTHSIQVPFAPETTASGIGDQGFHASVWYRRYFDAPTLALGERLHLHFEAVDYRATVWVNGTEVCTHEGGFTPFSVDITGNLLTEGPQEVIVHAEDDPADLAKPRGKQDWKLEPHSIWYPRTTGIWQTVWIEVVPTTYIQLLKWTCSLERWEIGLEAQVARVGMAPGSHINDDQATLSVRLSCDDKVLANDTYAVIAGEVHRRIALSDPGIDDSRNTLLWSPDSPTLIDVELELRDRQGKLLDRVTSYTAVRQVGTQGDRFVLNGRPLQLRMVLDQGYWPETGLTAPNDAALARDVILTKRLGFNGVRKHQKIESARFLYWADKLGLLVWEEMPSAYRYTSRSIQRLTREWQDVIKRDASHPCIITWVPFNESWGVPDLPESPGQRNYVQALYHLTKSLDPTRPCIGNDGWEYVATDIIGIHDYDADPERIGRRYGISEIENNLLKRERPGGRILALTKGEPAWDHPIVLTEFGGIALSREKNDWGYSRSGNSDELLTRYSALLKTVRQLPALAGFCYTQFTDTYQEANGLLYGDRTPKARAEALALATAGFVPEPDEKTLALWAEALGPDYAAALGPQMSESQLSTVGK